MSSVGSLKDQEAKKKKKKSWVRIGSSTAKGLFSHSQLVFLVSFILSKSDRAAWLMYDLCFPPLCWVILLFQVFEVSAVPVWSSNSYNFHSHSMMGHLKLQSGHLCWLTYCAANSLNEIDEKCLIKWMALNLSWEESSRHDEPLKWLITAKLTLIKWA